MTRSIRVVWMAVMVACTAEPAPTTDPATRRELDAAVAQYYRDMSARDWPAYASHFWPGATLTTVWQPPGESAARVVITSLEEFLGQTTEGPDSKPVFEERLLSQESRIVGDLAQVWAHYEVRFGDSAQVATWRGFDAFTWMKHDGVWRIVALAYTDEPGQPRSAP